MTALRLPLDIGEGQISDAGATSAAYRQSANLTDTDYDLSFLALAEIKGIGVHTLRSLMDQYPDLATIWRESRSSLCSALMQAQVKDAARIADEIMYGQADLLRLAHERRAWLRVRGVAILPITNPAFPQRLREVPGVPYWLFVSGNIEALSQPLVAVVGTRQPSYSGIQAASTLVRILARLKLGIVSGLAEGIDKAAHTGAVHYQLPQVAVLGTGIDVVFPAATAELREEIISRGGAVITEYLPGSSYNKAQFVQRNRIQAALAVAVAPVESKAASGTAHTLRFAESYNRPVFGVSYGLSDPQNSLLDVIAQHRHPIFDISDDEGKIEVKDWLLGVTGLTMPRKGVPQQLELDILCSTAVWRRYNDKGGRHMAVKAVIFDVSGTMVSGGRAVDGIIDAIERLQAMGVSVLAFCNESRLTTERMVRGAGIPIPNNLVISHDDVGANKGSPKWIEVASQRTDLAPNELLYVGNSTFDMATASRGKVIYLRADWTHTDDKKYGFPAPSPNWVRAVVEHIFRKRHLWYWELHANDAAGHPVDTMALCKVVRGTQFGDDLVNVFKSKKGIIVGGLSLRDFVMLHLTASIYASGLDPYSGLWTTYPGSKMGHPNEIMGEFLDVAAKMFRKEYAEALFIRHRDAQKSRDAYKNSGNDIVQAMSNQLDSVHLNPNFKAKIKGKSVLLFDNFITRGPSTEVPRNLLFAGGAGEVYAIGVGKYRNPLNIISPSANSTWNPFAPVHPDAANLDYRVEDGVYNEAAYAEFVRSWKAMAEEEL